MTFHLEGKVELLPQLSMEDIKAQLRDWFQQGGIERVKDQLKNLVASGEDVSLKKVIDYLKFIFKNSHTESAVIICLNKLNKFFYEKLEGILTTEEISRQQSSICKTILSLTKEVNEKQLKNRLNEKLTDEEKLSNNTNQLINIGAKKKEQKSKESKIRSLKRKNVEESPLSIVRVKKSMPSIKSGRQKVKWKRTFFIFFTLITFFFIFLSHKIWDTTNPSSTEKIWSDSYTRIDLGPTNSICCDETNDCSTSAYFYSWEGAKLACNRRGDEWELPDEKDLLFLRDSFYVLNSTIDHTIIQKGTSIIRLTHNGYFNVKEEECVLNNDIGMIWGKDKVRDSVICMIILEDELIVKKLKVNNQMASCLCIKK